MLTFVICGQCHVHKLVNLWGLTYLFSTDFVIQADKWAVFQRSVYIKKKKKRKKKRPKLYQARNVWLYVLKDLSSSCCCYGEKEGARGGRGDKRNWETFRGEEGDPVTSTSRGKQIFLPPVLRATVAPLINHSSLQVSGLSCLYKNWILIHSVRVCLSGTVLLQFLLFSSHDFDELLIVFLVLSPI